MLRNLLPKSLADALSIYRHRTYAEDGLMTSHLADFCQDQQFMSAYLKGKSTGSWGNGNLRWRVYTCCWAAANATGIPGDFVECGVNRGGTSLSVMEYVRFNSLDKRFYLLDTYKGFPEDLAALGASSNRDSYSDCFEDVVRTFAPFHNARVIAGSVPGTLQQVDTDSVCYLSIDMNSAEAEIAAMKFFWPKLVKGATVILDDYAYAEPYRRQKEAMDSLAREIKFNVLALPTGQGMIVKV